MTSVSNEHSSASIDTLEPHAGRCVNIMGIRGLPAAHGGFETFAAHLAPFLRDRGWTVNVYCQQDREGEPGAIWTDQWEGLTRTHIRPRTSGAKATAEFDLRAALDVSGKPGIDLVLGYNTAVVNLLQRLRGRRVVMNMDGIEWRRQKWGLLQKIWLWINEFAGGKICTVPIADHPEIASHLAGRGCKNAVVIPYGSDLVTDADVDVIRNMGLSPRGYFVSVARLEPENSILEMIEGFQRADTGLDMVVLGKFEPEANAYHSLLQSAAGPKVKFTGPIYELSTVQALRFHSLAYLHGHQVGGTNPSLVESLGAGAPVIAHGNRFNRWTAGDGQLYFSDSGQCAEAMKLLAGDPALRDRMSASSRARHSSAFTFSMVHEAYLQILEREADIATSRSGAKGR